MLAKFFAYNDSIAATPFLEQLTIMTESYKNKASFNLRILEVNDDGSPGKDLLGENIIVIVKNGKKNTEVDLRKYQLQFPEKGFFVSVEFLIIEENKYSVHVKGSKEMMDSYQPHFGALPSEDALTWRYIGGNWGLIKTKSKNKEPQDYYDKFANLAIQLTLTN
ncbi:hypothetical protein [Flavobacterium sp. 3HN19-14]|uniref:hypothetical protein n=1 Tax=Flavobacterium sp. 3HN19-14 TaxID=3448133 RepID=UPI003EE1B0A4